MDPLEHLVLTVIGDDRPGLVERVATLVARHHGNWLRSRMAQLAGHFAGIVEIELPRDHAAALRRALAELAADGLQVGAHPGRQAAPAPAGPSIVIEIVGADRPGIVNAISHVLAAHGVNVEELETKCESGAMTAEMIFRLRATATLPPEINAAGLRAELERLADDLMVELSFTET